MASLMISILKSSIFLNKLASMPISKWSIMTQMLLPTCSQSQRNQKTRRRMIKRKLELGAIIVTTRQLRSTKRWWRRGRGGRRSSEASKRSRNSTTIASSTNRLKREAWLAPESSYRPMNMKHKANRILPIKKIKARSWWWSISHRSRISSKTATNLCFNPLKSTKML